ncbi:hypothetical protein [Streptococcus danieliae]|uniref:hypothetical protein n=1 Tax=Streptococcus danieliae TaxID=747656 RepID=UPI0026EC6E56|nr:hypothetical protein [Streptococcus danieliae]
MNVRDEVFTMLKNGYMVSMAGKEISFMNKIENGVLIIEFQNGIPVFNNIVPNEHTA